MEFVPDDPTKETYYGRWGEPYRPEDTLISAANTALSLGLPLLLTGEPGCGKTDFAFVAARYLSGVEPECWTAGDPEHGLLECYVRSDTRSRDLLYTYDALRRFGDAHHGGEQDRLRAADARHYIEVEGLGRALASEVRRVVLVDEIDKAPRDLSNDLLRELDQGTFEVPEVSRSATGEVADPHGTPVRRRMGRRMRGDSNQPFIVVTSNAERQLPDAFLRRCVFHHLSFPEPSRLLRMLEDRFGPGRPEAPAERPGRVKEEVLEPAVAMFTRLRAHPGLLKRPATFELICWVRSFLTLSSPEEKRGFCRLAEDRIEWEQVPRLECLVKLREDLEALRLIAS